MDKTIFKTECTKQYKTAPQLKEVANLPWQEFDRVEVNTKEDVYWQDQPSILLTEWQKFFPRAYMTPTQKTNACMRLALFIGILLCILQSKITVFLLVIPVVVGFILWFVVYKDNIASFDGDVHPLAPGGAKSRVKKPTDNNPFMNTLLTELGKGPVPIAADTASPEIQEEIEEKFENNLLFDIEDLYRKNNSQNRFFTMPNTNEYGVKNGDTVMFANWLYSIPAPTCKEDTRFCTNNYARTFENHRGLSAQTQFY